MHPFHLNVIQMVENPDLLDETMKNDGHWKIGPRESLQLNLPIIDIVGRYTARYEVGIYTHSLFMTSETLPRNMSNYDTSVSRISTKGF